MQEVHTLANTLLSPKIIRWHNPPCNEGPSHATVASANRFSRVAEG
jgi:hypothetical protein